jgi:hypothetical protein
VNGFDGEISLVEAFNEDYIQVQLVPGHSQFQPFPRACGKGHDLGYRFRQLVLRGVAAPHDPRPWAIRRAYHLAGCVVDQVNPKGVTTMSQSSSQAPGHRGGRSARRQMRCHARPRPTMFCAGQSLPTVPERPWQGMEGWLGAVLLWRGQRPWAVPVRSTQVALGHTSKALLRAYSTWRKGVGLNTVVRPHPAMQPKSLIQVLGTMTD